MKVLFLNNFNYLRGGSEKILFEEMHILRGAGHEVEVFTRGHDQNMPSRYAKFFPPPIETELLDLSLKSLRTVKELIYSDASRRGLRQVIRRFKPEIAHAHNVYGRLSLSVIDELHDARVPVVMTLHDLKLLCPNYLMLNHGAVCERCRGRRYYNAVRTRCHKGSYAASAIYAFESWMNHIRGSYRKVSRFITPSRFLRDKCIEFGWDGRKISYVPNFVETAPGQEFDDKGRRAGGGGYLLYIGRLSREKGVSTLLQAYSGLKNPLPLKIAGDGPERRDLERKAQSARGQVTFTGYLKGPALQAVLSEARGVVTPSEWYENAPLSVLEALAFGKPVIGARIGGIPEMIDHGANGFLFEPGSAEDLKDKLELFLGLPEVIVLGMGKAAMQKAAREFSAESHYSRLMYVYREAMEREKVEVM